MPNSVLPLLFTAVVATTVAAESADGAFSRYAVNPISMPTQTGFSLSGFNDYGQVVGFYGLDAYVWIPDAPNGFNGTMHPLASLGGVTDIAIGINNRGQVVGRSNGQPVLWNPATPNGVPGPPVPLPPAAGHASGINERGQVVGADVTGARRSFLWSPTVPNGTSGIVTPIGTLAGAAISHASAVNNYGQVSGWSDKPYLWQPSSANATSGALHAINLSQPTSAYQNFINAGGSIAGNYFDAVNNAQRTFIWNPLSPNTPAGTTTIIPLFAAADGPATIGGINDARDVVSYDLSHGFIWNAQNGLADLNTLLDVSAEGWDVLHAFEINNVGHVLADALYTPPHGGEATYSVVVLTPVPEPAGAFIVPALLALCGARRGPRRFSRVLETQPCS